MNKGIPLTNIQNTICAHLILLKNVDRQKLCKMTGFPRTTVYDNLHILERLGIAQKSNGPSQGRGRPRVYWTLNKKRVRVTNKA